MYATVAETNVDQFFTDRHLAFTADDRFADQVEMLDSAVVELEQWACLERIEEQLYLPQFADRYAWSAIVNDVLAGRSDRSEPHFEEFERLVADPDLPPEVAERWANFKVKVAEFRAEHPDGIR